MLIEELCPRCRGPATFVEGMVHCSLCGEFEDDGDNCLGSHEHLDAEVESVSLLYPSPPSAGAAAATLELGDAPKDFPRETVSCTIPMSLAEEFGSPRDRDFEVKTGFALEFFFNYVESYGGLPEIEYVVEGERSNLELLSCHAYRLNELAEIVDKSKTELCDFALVLYAQFLAEK